MGHMALSWSENKACHGLSCFIIRIIIIFTFLQNCHFGEIMHNFWTKPDCRGTGLGSSIW